METPAAWAGSAGRTLQVLFGEIGEFHEMVRQIEGGIEFRTRFWMGYRINKGRGMCVLPPWVRIPVEAPMGLAYHNVMEYSNLASFLPEICAELGPGM